MKNGTDLDEFLASLDALATQTAKRVEKLSKETARDILAIDTFKPLTPQFSSNEQEVEIATHEEKSVTPFEPMYWSDDGDFEARLGVVLGATKKAWR